MSAAGDTTVGGILGAPRLPGDRVAHGKPDGSGDAVSSAAITTITAITDGETMAAVVSGGATAGELLRSGAREAVATDRGHGRFAWGTGRAIFRANSGHCGAAIDAAFLGTDDDGIRGGRGSIRDGRRVTRRAWLVLR
jgi:hypothetical protein